MLTYLLLFFLTVLLIYVVYLKVSMSYRVKKRIDRKKEDIRKETLDRSRASLKGKVAEQVVPFLENFDYNPSDARFVGSPIDYIIFDGHSDGDEIQIVLSEVKTGESARLNKIQRKIKEAVEDKRIEWRTIDLRTED